MMNVYEMLPFQLDTACNEFRLHQVQVMKNRYFVSAFTGGIILYSICFCSFHYSDVSLSETMH